MPMTMDERISMLMRASQAWLDLTRKIDRIPPGTMQQPQMDGAWNGKDLLIHLANWEELGLDVLESIEDGDVEEWPDTSGDALDILNAEMLEPYRNVSLDGARAYLEETHFALMDAAERAKRIDARVVLRVTVDHYAEHLPDIERLLAMKPGARKEHTG